MKQENSRQRLFEVMTRLDKTFKPRLNEELGFEEQGQGEKFRAEVTGKGENVWSTNAMEYDTEEEAKEWLRGLSNRWFGYDMGRVVPVSTPTNQPVDMENNIIFQNFREGVNEDDDKWIQKAVDPKHKGYCTPMTKDTCTPRRKALAKRFKAGIEDESIMEAIVGDNPEEYRTKAERLKQTIDNLFNEEHFDIIDTLYRLIVERRKPTAPELSEMNDASLQ